MVLRLFGCKQKKESRSTTTYNSQYKSYVHDNDYLVNINKHFITYSFMLYEHLTR